MHRFNKEIQAVGNRVDHIEAKMEKYAETINDLVDANDERKGDKGKASWHGGQIKKKQPKNKGIPDSLQQSDLNLYAATLFKHILPSLMDLDVTIDRKPQAFPSAWPHP